MDVFNFNESNLNATYPLEDFLEDMKGIEKAFGTPISKEARKIVPILNDDDEVVEEIELNTQHPMFKMSKYFQDKYGFPQSTPRLWRFHLIRLFITKERNLLIKNGLMRMRDNELLMRDDFNDFLDYLLKYKLKSHMKEIPRKAIKGYFLLKAGH